MKNGEFSQKIIDYTLENSRFENKRNYISLSQIFQPVDELIRQYKEGYESTLEGRLKCYKGYQIENDLLHRIKNVFINRIQLHKELSHPINKELFKGHPDFMYDEFPCDCKSVLMDDWLPKDGILPKRIYWQMQAYMMCLNTNKSLVVFESRENGKIVDFWVYANESIQNIIELKMIEINNILTEI